jgi:hypothetical protein
MFKNDKLTAAFFTALVFFGMLLLSLVIGSAIQYFGVNFIIFGLLIGMLYLILRSVYEHFLHSLAKKDEGRI